MIRHAEEVTGKVAVTCRYYGVSRQYFYTWKRRYDELGTRNVYRLDPAGLTELRAWLDTFWDTALERYADRVRQDSSPGTQT